MSVSEVLAEYITTTTRLIVDKPDEVIVNVSVSTKLIIIQIKTAKEDCGKIIGKMGKTIEALKLLALAIKNTMIPNDSKKVIIEILEEENSDFSYGRV